MRLCNNALIFTCISLGYIITKLCKLLQNCYKSIIPKYTPSVKFSFKNRCFDLTTKKYYVKFS